MIVNAVNVDLSPGCQFKEHHKKISWLDNRALSHFVDSKFTEVLS